MKKNNLTVLITGGSSGFGLELTKEFIRRKCKVIICSRDHRKLEKARKDINSKKLLYYSCDVRNPEEIGRLVNEIKKIDILVNCAGIYSRSSLINVSESLISAVIDTNLKGVIYFTHAVLPAMVKRNSGLIININSLTGLNGKKEQSLYAASKFGLRGFTESLREELEHTKIRILEIYPGSMNTQIYKNAGINKISYRRIDPALVADLTLYILENSKFNLINNILVNGVRGS
ncbi:SDR family oxidoreductase [Patescibacteria group bacterium]|nr:SDR family oxidoreductase [Patescibacteria group bacterium]